MPVRSLRSLMHSVWRWPTPEQVLQQMQAWAVEQKQIAPELQQVGVFGSYGRGNAGFGSDINRLIVDLDATGGQIDRLQRWSLEKLPLRCDVRVLMPAELQHDLRWLL